jgi:hypothetical protein
MGTLRVKSTRPQPFIFPIECGPMRWRLNWRPRYIRTIVRESKSSRTKRAVSKSGVGSSLIAEIEDTRRSDSFCTPSQARLRLNYHPAHLPSSRNRIPC